MITPWKLNIALDKLPSQKENSFPTIIYQGQTVKLRECTFKKNFLRRWIIFPFEGWWEYSTLENYHGTPKWKLGRWFKKISISIGWFLGSMLIFQGVLSLKSFWFWNFITSKDSAMSSHAECQTQGLSAEGVGLFMNITSSDEGCVSVHYPPWN